MQRGLDTEYLFFQQGDDVHRGRGLIEEHLRQSLLRCRQQTTLVEVHETLSSGARIGCREPVCRHAGGLVRFQCESESPPGIRLCGKSL
jgi:hypothetical protein